MKLGLEELINTLRANEKSRLDEIWQSVETEAAKLREQTDETIGEFTENHTDSLVCNCQKSIRTIISEAETRAREVKLFAMESLGKSLHMAAVKQLHNLRNEEYDAVFEKLAQELPQQKWQTITVSPDDTARTEKMFAGCTVKTDPAITGGMMAEAQNKQIIIDNTFEKRLERCWSKLFPSLAREIEKEYVESKSLTETTAK